MKVRLMFADRDFDGGFQPPPRVAVLSSDLELETLFDAMAGKDPLIADAARSALFQSLAKPEEILYRQDALKDCIRDPAVVREVYRIAAEAIENRRNYWWGISGTNMSSVLSTSVELLQMFAGQLRRLRRLADAPAEFESAGFRNLLSMLRAELSDEYFDLVETHLNELKFRNGVLVRAELGSYNQGVRYALCRQPDRRRYRLKWRLTPGVTVSPRDENGCADLSKRRERAMNGAADTLAQSAEHVLLFFTLLRAELAFYVGCLNLYDRLCAKGEPIAFPQICEGRDIRHTFRGLYDVSLSLITNGRVVGNRIDASGKELVVITGANQGGKSTFLRSVGQAQLMMQCGMFVGAEAFEATLCSGVFTHYKKEEDPAMKSGKLDEELGRMSDIADEIKPRALILFNESFSATNEREGSEIARQIVRALLDNQIRVYFVTHFYDLAHSFYVLGRSEYLFLRAQRAKDGSRTFRLSEGEPLKTSYGDDVYKKVFNKISELSGRG